MHMLSACAYLLVNTRSKSRYCVGCIEEPQRKEHRLGTQVLSITSTTHFFSLIVSILGKFHGASFTLFVLRNALTRFDSLNATQVLSKIESQNYDGGTDLSRLSIKQSEGFDLLLLFSDGLSTLGMSEASVPC